LDKYIWTEEELPQRSPEWEIIRGTVCGGSDIPSILGVNKFEKPETFFKRKIGKLKKKAENEFMLRGAEMEDEAKQAVIAELSKEEYGLKHPPRMDGYFVKHTEFPYIGISFDGVDLDNGFITELKCPKMLHIFRSVWENGIQDYYYPQIQMQMFVAKNAWGIDKGYFASYYPEGAWILNYIEYKEYRKTLCVIDIDYDEKYCLAATKVIRKFWDYVEAKEWDRGEYREILKQFNEEIQ